MRAASDRARRQRDLGRPPDAAADAAGLRRRRRNSCSATTKPISRRLWGMEATGQYFKDGINDYIVDGDRDAVNPARLGTKAAAHYRLELPPGGAATLRLRLAHDHEAPGSTISTRS